MANAQIPNLSAAIALNGTEQIEAVQAGTSVRITTSQITELVPAGPTGPAGPQGPVGPEGPAGNASNVNTVADFEGSSFSAVVESVNILGYYSIGVGALTVRRVASEPTHPWKFRSLDRYLPNGSTDNANGGWWEGYTTNNIITPQMFGAVADGVTDDHPAISSALDYIALNGVGIYGFNSTFELHFPAGAYFSSQTIKLWSPTYTDYDQGMWIRVTGEGMGSNYQPTTTIYFPLGVQGMEAGFYGFRTLIEGLTLIGTQDAADTTVAHGLVCKTQVRLKDCRISNFQGHGVYLPGIGFNPPVSSQSNLSYVEGCVSIENRFSGFATYGPDSNAMTFVNCQSLENGQGGFLDASQHANVYIGCQTSGNGVPSNATVSGTGNSGAFCYYSGKMYIVNPLQDSPTTANAYVTASFASTTTPGTNSSVWTYVGDYPGNDGIYHGQPWVSGMTWGPGGDLIAIGAPPVCVGFYSEGYANCFVNSATGTYPLFIGGTVPRMWPWSTQLSGGKNGALFNKNGFIMDNTPQASTGFSRTTMEFGVTNANGNPNNLITYTIGFQPSNNWLLTEGCAQWYESGGEFWGVVTSQNTRFNSGAQGLWALRLWLCTRGIVNAVQLSVVDNAPPSTGTAKLGDIAFNNTASPGAPFAWQCTTAGTNGSSSVWTPLRAVLGATTFAGLPSAATAGAGARGFVTDSTQTLAAGLGTVVAGGSTEKVPVYSDGVDWRIG